MLLRRQPFLFFFFFFFDREESLWKKQSNAAVNFCLGQPNLLISGRAVMGVDDSERQGEKLPRVMN